MSIATNRARVAATWEGVVACCASPRPSPGLRRGALFRLSSALDAVSQTVASRVDAPRHMVDEEAPHEGPQIGWQGSGQVREIRPSPGRDEKDERRPEWKERAGMIVGGGSVQVFHVMARSVGSGLKNQPDVREQKLRRAPRRHVMIVMGENADRFRVTVLMVHGRCCATPVEQRAPTASKPGIANTAFTTMSSRTK